MKTNTKRLFFTLVLLGTVFSVLTATTVMASTNDTPCGQQIRDQDRIHEQDQCCQNEDSCPETCDGVQAQHQRGLTCFTGGGSETVMHQARYRYQYRHCNNQET